MKHIISVLVENKFGVLARISGLFSARGFNIESLAVAETEDPTISRMTIVVGGDEKILEQVKKQLNKLVDVIKIYDLTGGEFIDRELILIKMASTTHNRSKIIEIAETLKVKVVDVGPKTLTLEATGDQNKIHTTLELLRPFGIKEIVRTGRIGMATGELQGNTRSSKKSALTLIELMMTILIIGLLVAMATPEFIKARITARRNACINNLRIIDAAKDQWEIGNRSEDWPEAEEDRLVGVTPYLKRTVECPAAGQYLIGSLGGAPTCTYQNEHELY